ncbi:xanthine dehydrogenase family protein molybdopterin-binding subunit [Nesterenkonia populi]|uniref:xanthine dehydrogenase family protein molybdopterin-binding subunit n=1 Tax=Nesterenkonia populi TaxID=1591087 RepID=UPI0011BE4F41|nr:xanthine dehydrogenase family protein molybdopterin-binding subunit [Nesterenkonia populi]
MKPNSTKTLVGSSAARREDPRLLSGRGRFVDDMHAPGMLHAVFVRSAHAHARLIGIDSAEAQQMPGVAAVFTAEDLRLGPIVAGLDRPAKEWAETAMPILASGKVRFVGEPIAVVVASDPYAAEDAAEQVDVSYDPLDPVLGDDQALSAGAPVVHEEAPQNTLVDVSLFATEGIDRILDEAHTVVEVDLRTGRQNALPLETRGALAQWDDRSEQMVVHTCTQTPHQVRTVAAESLGLLERQVRIVVPDMGGGFGQKCVVSREEIATAAAALRLRKPVKWIEDRREALTAAFLARQQHYTARAAFSSDGEFLALDVDVICDMGAYSVYPFTAGIEPLMASAEMPGVYRLGAYRVRGRAVTTNKAPTAPYRGVSRPQYVLLLEHIMERAAAELGMTSVDIRRRNLITEFPYKSVNNITYDPGSYLESLELCEKLVQERGWPQMQQKAAEEGRRIGIGYSCFSERTGYGTGAFAQRKMKAVPGFDLAEARMDFTGAVTITSATINHGQSHETTMSQIAADVLGVELSAVRLEQGDTERVPYGWGTFASRSIVVGGSAVRNAASRLKEKMLALGAHLLEAEADQVEMHHGGVRVLGEPERSVSHTEIATVAYLQAQRLPEGMPPGLSESDSFDVFNDGTFSNATHAALVEVHEGTGQPEILSFLCVEDCGVAINPQVVEGQARGGIAQGIAGALFEEIEYDAAGHPLAGSFMDYRTPTAQEIPDIEIHHLETPCLFNETGAKGAGEGGTIGAPAAVVNAINDACRGTGAEFSHVPITSRDIHAALFAATTTSKLQEA